MRRLVMAVGLVLVCAARLSAATCPQGQIGASGWTLVDCQSVSGVQTCCSLTNDPLVHRSNVLVGDTLVVMCDSTIGDSSTGLMAMHASDNFGNTYHRVQGQEQYQYVAYNSPPRVAEDISYWWTVNTHAGPGWQARCSATRLGAAEFKDIDISGMVFRHSSGRGAAGFVVASKAVIDDVSRGTVCPCPHTPVATFAGLTPDSLLIAGGNMNGAPTWVNAPWVGCDGDGSSPGGALAWYSFCAAVGRDGSAPATFAWADSQPADFGSYAVTALLPPTATPPPPATGLTLEYVLQLLCHVYGW